MGNLTSIFPGGFNADGKMATAALAYAAMGWPVFPLYEIADKRCTCGRACDSPGKHPRTAHGVKDASTDPGTVRAWWAQWPDANIGIATGRTSGFFAIDVDPRNGGDTDRLGEIPDTVVQLTGGGGQHLLFRYPEQGRVRQGNNLLGPGLDVKSDGGYIVADPSNHISGGTYAWEASSDPTDGVACLDAPPALLARLAEPERTDPPEPPSPESLPEWKQRELAGALVHIPADDYETWVRVGMALHSTRAEAAFRLWELWSASSEKFKPGACAEKWRSFHDTGGITLSTVYALAKQYGWTDPGGLAAPPEGEAQAPTEGYFVMAADVVATVKPPEFVVHGLKTLDSFGSDFGDWGVGKSFRAMDEGVRISKGMPVQMRQVRQGPVVYVMGEGMGGLGRRLLAWATYNKETLGGAPFFFTRSAVPLLDEIEARRLRDQIARLSDRLGVPPVAIYIDTLARNFGDGDESKTPDMNRFVSAVDRHLREPFRACVTAIHHPGHMDKSRGRGGSALPAALDWEYRLERVMNGLFRMVHGKPPKDFEPPAPLLYRLVTVPIEIHGEVTTSATVEAQSGAPESGEPTTRPSEGNEAVLAVLVELTRQHRENQGDRDDAIPRVLTSDWRDAAIAAGVATKNTFYKHHKDLVAAGSVLTDAPYSASLTHE